MRGTSYADAITEVFDTPAALPRSALDLMNRAGSVFAGRSWWDVVLAEAMPAESRAAFVVCRTGGIVVAVVPMQQSAAGPLESLTTPYTCLYTPLIAAGLDHETCVAAMAAFATRCRGGGVTRLDALPSDWDGLPALLAGARQAGLRPLMFQHFGNWYEDVAGESWSSYLARRPGALRETIRRRLRRSEKLAGARFTLLSGEVGINRAADAFETVYARSWKEPEPFPRFNVALMRAMAAQGTLRFGLWSVGETDVAVQVWVVRDGHATVLKLAHDEAYKAHSPGTVLTALMLRHLLDEESVTQIDFGRGDDDYKKGWAAQRRQRIGVLLVNPWRPSGAREILRHAAGRLRAALHRTPVRAS